MPELTGINGGPWWSRLSIAALAIVSFVYLGEALGGRYIELLESDLKAQRQISAKIAGHLQIASIEAERRNDLIVAYNSNAEETTRIQRRILEVLEKRCP